jgi:predicted dithiol-disulfide oxidoreductase (DUF899 family)
LDEERKLSHYQAEVARLRQSLPWKEVGDYTFHDVNGNPVTLQDLFGERDRLIVQHFMYEGKREGGSHEDGPCSLCSLWTQNFLSVLPFVSSRCSIVVIAKAPPQVWTLPSSRKSNPIWIARFINFRISLGFKGTPNWERMARNPPNFIIRKHFQFGLWGWIHQRTTRFGGCSFALEELSFSNVPQFQTCYNYGRPWPYASQAPGISVFALSSTEGSSQKVFHTYSTFGPGLAAFHPMFAIMDSLPEGREEKEKGNMWWVRGKSDK